LRREPLPLDDTGAKRPVLTVLNVSFSVTTDWPPLTGFARMPPMAPKKLASVCPHDCPSDCALEIEVADNS